MDKRVRKFSSPQEFTPIDAARRLLSGYKESWEKGRLTPSQLAHFNELVDEVILEARRPRSSWLPNDLAPEKFLVNLFERRIESTVFRFLKDSRLLASAVKEARSYGERPNKKLQETVFFRSWLNHARQFVEIEILGDNANRADRRCQTEPYFERHESSEEKSRTLINRRLKAHHDRILGLKKGQKSQNIPSEETRLTRVSLGEDFEGIPVAEKIPMVDSGSDDLWKDIPLPHDKITWEELEKHPRLLLRDEAAIRAAKNRARNKGAGYQPGYLPSKKLKDLEQKLYKACVGFLDWDTYPGDTIDERLAFLGDLPRDDRLIELEKGLGMPIQELCAQIQTFPKTNLAAYLFGRGKRLYTRLRDLKRQNDKPPRRFTTQFNDEGKALSFLHKVNLSDSEATFEQVADDLWKVKWTYYPKVSEKPYVPVDIIGDGKATVPIPFTPPSIEKNQLEILINEEDRSETIKEIEKIIIRNLPSKLHERVFRYRVIEGLKKQRTIAKMVNRHESRVSQVVKDLKEIIRSDPEKMKILAEYYELFHS